MKPQVETWGRAENPTSPVGATLLRACPFAAGTGSPLQGFSVSCATPGFRPGFLLGQPRRGFHLCPSATSAAKNFLPARGVPQARAPRRAWGYVCSAPPGRLGAKAFLPSFPRRSGVRKRTSAARRSRIPRRRRGRLRSHARGRKIRAIRGFKKTVRFLGRKTGRRSRTPSPRDFSERRSFLVAVPAQTGNNAGTDSEKI